jgi:hypothetical protein
MNTVTQNSLCKRTFRDRVPEQTGQITCIVESGNFPLVTLKYELLRMCNGLFNIY